MAKINARRLEELRTHHAGLMSLYETGRMTEGAEAQLHRVTRDLRLAERVMAIREAKKAARRNAAAGGQAQVQKPKKIKRKDQPARHRWLESELSISGLTPYDEINAFYRSSEWAQARYKVLVEHGARCLCCGRTAKDGSVMNVDHIKPLRTHWRLRLEHTNLQVLCGKCNRGKGSRDTTDWRPVGD